MFNLLGMVFDIFHPGQTFGCSCADYIGKFCYAVIYVQYFTIKEGLGGFVLRQIIVLIGLPLIPFKPPLHLCFVPLWNIDLYSIIRFVLRHSTTVLMVQNNVITTGKKDVSSIMI